MKGPKVQIVVESHFDSARLGRERIYRRREKKNQVEEILTQLLLEKLV